MLESWWVVGLAHEAWEWAVVWWVDSATHLLCCRASALKFLWLKKVLEIFVCKAQAKK